jgi:hypothetical protein
VQLNRQSPTAKAVWASCVLACAAACAAIATTGASAQAGGTDLDAFMKQVLAQRDENWKKLQQYVLDERETIDIRGPGRTPLWGERREYTWFIRDGFFIRSPVKVNGVEISDGERRKAEAEYLKRQQEREKRRARIAAGQEKPENSGPITNEGVVVTRDDDPRDNPVEAMNVDGLLKQTRQPQFISSAYFLRFRFEEGKYALVGRETIDGRETLRVEYYPSQLFRGTDRRRDRNGTSDEDRAYDESFRRLMNKVALVTLWVEPKAHQIVKYTFNNVGFDFLPIQWFVHIDQLRATMTMGQPFPDVYLPRDLEMGADFTLAVGQVDLRYAIEYRDYRRADVTSKVTIR